MYYIIIIIIIIIIITIIIKIYRFQPLEEKPRQKPVIHMQNTEIKKHFGIETSAKNVKFLYANGRMKKSIRPGNLGAEAANQYLNSYGWHRSAAGLRTWYIRSDIWFLSVNINKFHYWTNELIENHHELYIEFEEIIKKIDNLEYYASNKIEMTGNKLIPSIPLYVKEKKSNRGKHLQEVDDLINDRIQIDKLKFKQPFESPNKWGPFEMYSILERKQDRKWKLNKKTLHQLFIQFNRRWTKQEIKQYCSQTGIDFIYE